MDKTEHLKMVNTAIEKRGLKKKWIASKIGVSKDTLGAYLSGKRELGQSALILLSQVLNLDEASDKAS